MTEKEIKLVEENIPLALHVAKRWTERTGMDMDDTVSAAEYGLVKAARGFDPGPRTVQHICRKDHGERDPHGAEEAQQKEQGNASEDPIEGTEGLKLKDMLADPRDCFELSEQCAS